MKITCSLCGRSDLETTDATRLPSHASATDGRPCAGETPARIIGRVSIRKTPGEREFHIRAWDTNGKRFPDADCFETDRPAAEGTARAMLNPAAPGDSRNVPTDADLAALAADLAAD